MPRIIAPPTPSVAQRISAAPSIILRGIVQGWTRSFRDLWGNPLPPGAAPEAVAERNAKAAAILAELGTEAGPIMEDSRELVEFFLPRLPEEDRAGIMQLIASKPATTTHPDGTVTID